MHKLYRKPEKGETTAIFVDPAEGGDYSAMVAMSKKYLDAFMVYHSKTGETDTEVGSSQLGNEASKMGKFIFSFTKAWPWIAVERNKGQATISRLLELEYPRIWRMRTFDLQENKQKEYFGWETNKKTRPKMLDEWAEALNKHEATIYSNEVVEEHFAFVRPDKNPHHPEAIQGKNDDLVISCAGVWQVINLVENERTQKTKTTQAWDTDFGKVYR